ncbi:hypothetical protein VaNZ11_004511 [Volvox africanus]|uniref:Pherophorin domain-containing protein n=1 Tax=Volvox africanus TaxID=51714 RepID=A0ABQ5RWF2_9CHLO|nr:hypothetical protein VaNZ11_004511 [Volvox africanus]
MLSDHLTCRKCFPKPRSRSETPQQLQWSLLLQRILRLQLLFLLQAAILAQLFVPGTCSCGCGKEEEEVRTACPERLGYMSFPDMMTIYVSGNFFPLSGEGVNGTDSHAALASCTAAPNCITFNNLGSTGTLGSVIYLAKGADSVCTYIKRVFPEVRGYTLRPFLEWFPEEDAVVVHEGSSRAAKAACDSQPTCTAWTSSGQYVLGSVVADEFRVSQLRVALYLKQVCPERSGYVTHAGSVLAGADGSITNNTVSFDRLPSGSEAEEFCRQNYDCTAFSSDGSVAIGSISNLTLIPGVCTYVKKVCTPMRGFTAYKDVNLMSAYVPDDVVDPAAALSLGDTYTACLLDPNCVAFNSLQDTWSAAAAPQRVELHDNANIESVPGCCLYFKIPDGVRGIW